MANIYWAGPKAPKPATKEALMKELVNCTDDAFHVRFESDGAGHMVCVYVEAPEERRDPYEWKKLIDGLPMYHPTPYYSTALVPHPRRYPCLT